MNSALPAPGFRDNPGHDVTISSTNDEYVLAFAGVEIARSKSVLIVNEANYPPRPYFPKSDVNMAHLHSVDHWTNCPFKGQARYWDIEMASSFLENGAWAYDEPYQECLELAGYICFYTENDYFDLEILPGKG